jgi:hypothetical protein
MNPELAAACEAVMTTAPHELRAGDPKARAAAQSIVSA